MRQMQVFHFQRSIFNANEINMVKHSAQGRAKDWGLEGFILSIFSPCGGTDPCTHRRGGWHTLLLPSSAHAEILSAVSLIRSNYKTINKSKKNQILRHSCVQLQGLRVSEWELTASVGRSWGSLHVSRNAAQTFFFPFPALPYCS